MIDVVIGISHDGYEIVVRGETKDKRYMLSSYMDQDDLDELKELIELIGRDAVVTQEDFH